MPPRCGHCQYELTGAPGNRCPECGLLFIEAGVDLGPQHISARRRFGLVFSLAATLLLGLSLALFASAYYRQAARAQAIAQQRAAVAQIQAAYNARNPNPKSNTTPNPQHRESAPD